MRYITQLPSISRQVRHYSRFAAGERKNTFGTDYQPHHSRLQLPSGMKINPTINTLACIRQYSSTASDIPSTESCPCGSNLTIPDLGGQVIDKDAPLAGVITRHYRHVLIHTGTTDWPSRIEDGNSMKSKLKSLLSRKNHTEEETSIAAKLKSLVSRGSIYVDPFYPILVTNTSLPTNPTAENGHATITIFPEGIEISSIPNSMESLKTLVTSFLLPPSNSLSTPQKDDPPFVTKAISKPVILTCSHGNRDKRCGILGPAISNAFKEVLGTDSEGQTLEAIVGDISHIGGHKFAGNVIIHLPGDHALSRAINKAPASSVPASRPEEYEETGNTTRSVSIWYGRVMPYHAKGIIETTIRQGNIIKDLLRGIVNSNGDLVDLQSTGLSEPK